MWFMTLRLIHLSEEWLPEPAIAPAPLEDQRIANNGAVLVEDVDEEEEANEFHTDQNFSCATSTEADEPHPPLHQDLFDTDQNFNFATSNEADEPPPPPFLAGCTSNLESSRPVRSGAGVRLPQQYDAFLNVNISEPDYQDDIEHTVDPAMIARYSAI